MKTIVFGSSESQHAKSSVASCILMALGFQLDAGATWESVQNLADRFDGGLISPNNSPFNSRALLYIPVSKIGKLNLMTLTVFSYDNDISGFWEQLKNNVLELNEENSIWTMNGAIAVVKCDNEADIEMSSLSTQSINAGPSRRALSRDECIKIKEKWRNKKVLNHVERAESIALDVWDDEWCD